MSFPDNLFKVTLPQKVSQNTFLLFSSQVVSKIIAFFYAVFLARSLGPSDFGLYIYAITIFGLVSQVADFGFNRFIVRDVAKDKKRASFYLANVFTLRLLIMTFVLAVFSLIIIFFDPKIERSSLAILASLAILPNALSLTFEAIFMAFEKMIYPALALIFLNLSVLFLGLIAVLGFGFGVFGAVLTFFLAHIIYFVIYIFFVFREKITFYFNFDLAFFKKALLSSFPYGLLAVLGLIYFKIDTVLLTFLRGEEETGFYTASFKFLEALHFIPLTVGTALFPLMARLHEKDPKYLASLYFSIIRLLLIISLPTFFLLIIFAKPLILLIYGYSFTPSILVLQILSFTIIFMFLHVPGAHLLFATEKFLKPVLLLSFITVGLNIILNLIFIPILGLLGASMVTVFSELTSFLVFFILIYKVVLKAKTR